MQKIKQQLVLLLFAFGITYGVAAQSFEAQADQVMLAQYKPDGPGAAILVAKNGKAVYRKAFGKANLELNVAMTPENVFELGSITKQFTAVGILMLMEQGKLSLSDEITKFIPDYPTKGKKITIHHLLNHTSGIKSYTDMEGFRKLARTDMAPMELINVFKNEPMDFDPGEQWRYNNSGYILLGYIIEKASGKTYENFIEEDIFRKLGMTHSWYGSKGEIIPNRASGYQPAAGGFANADYLSMTLPYAAGSLMSTIDDMLIWSQAIHNNSLIKKEDLQKAFTNHPLNNGEPMYYGYGWGPNEVNGIPSMEHSGGIFGYTTMGVYLPGENVYVIVLTNNSAVSPSEVAIKIAALAAGKPYATKASAQLTEAQLKTWTGIYEFDKGLLREISFDNGFLYSQRQGGKKTKLLATGPAAFTFDGGFTQYEFTEAQGKKTVLLKDRIRKSNGVRTDKTSLTPTASGALDSTILKQYLGTYELQPGFEIEVTSAGSQLFAQATGQARFELFASKPGSFFLKVVEASIDFNKDTNGKITSLTLHQGGRDMEGKKIK
jgi:CubicO group peptidase (beta-lactamase class C family)